MRHRLAGYDGWLSIEHEDINIGRLEGVRRAIQPLHGVAPVGPTDYAVQEI